MMRRALYAVLCSLFMMSAARAEDVSQLTIGAGVFDLRSNQKQYAEVDAQFRFGWGLFGGDGVFRGIKPIIGVMGTHKGAVMGWAGVAMPLWLAGGAWEIEPSMAIGAYDKGGRTGLDLGGVRQFHLGVNISYRMSEHARLGAAITHISNAGSQRINPGVNSALLTFTWMFTD